MRSDSRNLGWIAVTGVAVALIGVALVRGGGGAADVEYPRAYELVALEGIDTLTSLDEAAARIEACGGESCSSVVFVWSPRMPLSRSAIPEVARAAGMVGADLTLIGFEELEAYAESAAGRSTPSAARTSERTRSDPIESLLAAGALTHAPSLAVFDGRRIEGPAILGYKSAEAYRTLIAERLSGVSRVESSGSSVLVAEAPERPGPVTFADYPAVGVPGAYFRWVPGRNALAYEADGRVYLLDLEDGQNRIAPGFIDFVPTPDGRYFVTPAPRNAGLAFFDASEVFEAARAGRPGDVRPIAVDDRMRDQYPSVGILAQDETSVRYRVLTSWFEGLLYRDYDVRFGEPGSASEVSPLGAPVVPCAGMALSTPIMSQDGTEVAVREEASGTTKIYRILPEGRCEEVLALGMPTRKVAWHRSGRKLAFSTPRVRSETGGGADPGIFVYDRDERRLTRIADSEGASQLAFPDFVGDEAVVFMVPDRNRRGESFFRVVQPIP